MRIWTALWMCPELRRVARNKSGEGGERGPLSPPKKRNHMRGGDHGCAFDG
nr:MAG TPA: hypothetical protein [Caudoviricetes sp.]